MTAGPTRMVKTTDFKTTFFVRAGLTKLDGERIAYLKSLVEAGVTLPPIEVTPELQMLCGRHRLAVYIELGYEQVPVRVITLGTPAEYIAYAFKDNAVSSLPPTRADVRLVLQQLSASGLNEADVIKLFVPPYNKAFIKQQLDWNRANAKHIKLRAAHNARNDEDLSFPVAAERYGVSVEELKDFARGKKIDRERTITSLRKEVHQMNQSYGARLKTVLHDIDDAYNSGNLSAEEVFSLLREPMNYAQTITRRARDAEKRFAAAINLDETTAKMESVDAE